MANLVQEKALRFWLWSAGLVLMGAALLVLSLIGELWVEHADEYSRTVAEQQRLEQILQQALHPENPVKQQGLTEEYVMRKWAGLVSANGSRIVFSLVRDIGIALIVSVGLVLLLEKANRKVLEREFEDRLQNVGTRTIGAVFENDHPQELFRNVRDSIFREPLLRENFVVTATLWKLDPATPGLTEGARTAIRTFISEADSLGENKDKLVAMQVETSYGIRNVSEVEQKFDPPFAMEMYFQAATAETCRIESVRIGLDELLSKCEVRRDGNALTCHLPTALKLAPAESRQIAFTAFAIRHLHDDEVWCSALLTQGMSAALRDYTGLGVDLEVQRLCSPPEAHDNFQDRRPAVEIGTRGCVLPWQSFVLSWGPGAQSKKKPPAAGAVAAIS